MLKRSLILIFKLKKKYDNIENICSITLTFNDSWNHTCN